MMELPDPVTLDGIRDRVMIELLYATGIRSHELLSMQVHSVWLSERRAAVIGKGNKERLVVLNESAAKWLGYYLKVVHPRLLRRRRLASIPTKSDGCVFPSTRVPAPLSYGTLRLRIKEYALQANMPLLTAHTLRRAFATHLYQGGADLRSIQLLLGHAHLATTTLYTQALTPRLHEIIEMHHPRGSLYKHG
jgi:integrase/recombinase XerD